MMQVAYLNNHNTAAAWVIRVFSELGVGTYVPVICGEVGSLSGDDARNARTSSLDAATEALLDGIDVYRPELSIGPEHIRVLDRNFDAVIFPGAVRTPNLHYVAEHCRLPIVVYEWGDVGNVAFHHEYADVIRERRNVTAAVAYQAFDAAALHLPLGLPRDLHRSDYPAIDFDQPTFALVASRLYQPGTYTRDSVLRFIDGIDGSGCDLLVIGKDHRDPEVEAIFDQGWDHVEVLSDLTRDRLCSVLASVNGLLYWMREPTVVQLSPFESASLGTPIIYPADTMLSDLLPTDDAGRTRSPAEVTNALTAFADTGTGRACADRQWAALHPLMQDGPAKWSAVLRLPRASRLSFPGRR